MDKTTAIKKLCDMLIYNHNKKVSNPENFALYWRKDIPDLLNQSKSLDFDAQLLSYHSLYNAVTSLETTENDKLVFKPILFLIEISDAAGIDEPFSRDLYYLDVDTGKILLDSYLYRFAHDYRGYRHVYFMSAADFNWHLRTPACASHITANQADLYDSLLHFKTEADWNEVFNDLNSIIAEEKAVLDDTKRRIKDKKEKRIEEERIKMRITIPDTYKKPALSYPLDLVRISYKGDSLLISRQENVYRTIFEPNKKAGFALPRYECTLTEAEAKWFEAAINDAVFNTANDRDDATSPDDRMDVRIIIKGLVVVNIQNKRPLKKYTSILSDLTRLAAFGSNS